MKTNLWKLNDCSTTQDRCLKLMKRPSNRLATYYSKGKCLLAKRITWAIFNGLLTFQLISYKNKSGLLFKMLNAVNIQ
jgi:hypothetical protein